MKNLFRIGLVLVLLYLVITNIDTSSIDIGIIASNDNTSGNFQNNWNSDSNDNYPSSTDSQVTWGSAVDLRNHSAPFDGFGYAKKAIDYGYATTTLEKDFNTLLRIRNKQNPDQDDLDRSNAIHAKWAVIIGYPYIAPMTLVVPNPGINIDASTNFGGHAGDYRSAEFCQQVRYFWNERPGAINNASAVEKSCREANKVALKDMFAQLNSQGWAPDAIEFQLSRFTTPACEAAFDTSGAYNDVTECILPGPIFR